MLLRRIAREPFVHFVVAGVLLFAIIEWWNVDAEEGTRRILVGEERVLRLASDFERRWLRPPTETELRGLVDDLLREEILYREALEIGLDRDDAVVRRRMRQKMEFLAEGLVDSREPSSAELREFYAQRPELFREPTRVTLAQVFLGEQSSERADDLRESLQSGAVDADQAGAPTLLPRSVDRATLDEVGRLFGAEFAAALQGVPEATWFGPLRSSFGLHLVRIEQREPGRLPEFDEVGESVQEEFALRDRENAKQRLYDTLREKYEVQIRMPGAIVPEALVGN